ncbi:hypothetical protein RvY_13677 [Ramazzottius varieornatus]|uniref:Uncharacterized protein n=1 Tax=Ramazzottius varieornatus TaxID=947166 RepID=A0A1D1VTY2_RAMVA|nr:hypothetical protein RvY_13677 [Ramazzottius varieornatus]
MSLGLLTHGSDSHPDGIRCRCGWIRRAVGWIELPSESVADGWVFYPDDPDLIRIKTRSLA